MNARHAAIAAYGGACAWCGSTDRLELDHLHGGGSQHRRDMTARGTRLEYELRRLGYPPGYQLLCVACHELRTILQGKPMPPANGKVGKHYSFRGEIAKHIATLATKQGVDESLIVENAILEHVEGLNGHGKQLLGTLAERHMTLIAQVETLTATVKQLTIALEHLKGDVKNLDDKVKRDITKTDQTLKAIYDAVNTIITWTQKRWLSRS